MLWNTLQLFLKKEYHDSQFWHGHSLRCAELKNQAVFFWRLHNAVSILNTTELYTEKYSGKFYVYFTPTFLKSKLQNRSNYSAYTCYNLQRNFSCRFISIDVCREINRKLIRLDLPNLFLLQTNSENGLFSFSPWVSEVRGKARVSQ